MEINGMPNPRDPSVAFVEWFKSQPGASLNPNIQLVDLSACGRGRGVLAISDIPAHTDLFVVPRASVLSPETSELTQRIPQIFRGANKSDTNDRDSDDGVDLDELSQPGLELITILIYEYLHRETSKWRPYLDMLPEEFDTLMYWKALELRELQSSAILEKIGRDEAEQMFREKLLPSVKQHADVFYPAGMHALGDNVLIQLAHRMGSIITAYAFDLEKEDGSVAGTEDGWVQDFDNLMALGLVPMADMLNADAEFNAHLNHEETSLTMTSLRPIKAGEEILNYYGPLPNSELLLRYGYTSPKHSLYDIAEISWPLIRQAIRDELGEEVSLPADEDVDESFVLERESDGPDETGIINSSATFTEFPGELEDQVVPILAPVLGINLQNHQLNSSEQRQLGRSFLNVMSKALQARLKQYGTTIATDQELLRAAKPGTRYCKAIAVRLGEKCLIQEAIDFIANALNDIEHAPTEEADARATKKQRMAR